MADYRDFIALEHVYIIIAVIFLPLILLNDPENFRKHVKVKRAALSAGRQVIKPAQHDSINFIPNLFVAHPEKPAGCPAAGIVPGGNAVAWPDAFKRGPENS